MKIRQTRALAITVIAITLAGCGSSASMSSPTATFKTVLKAQREKDVATYMKAQAKAGLKEMEGLVKRNGKYKTLEDFYRATLNDTRTGTMAANDPEIRNEKIDGDKGSLEFRYPGGEWQTQSFVKEDGEWKEELVLHVDAGKD